MIELKDLSFSYGEKEVLKNLSYTFPDRGIFAVMGGSGEGKTTLLRLLATLEKPCSGEITSTHKKIAIAFQEPRLLPWLNAENNLKFVLSKEKIANGTARSLLREFELSECAKQLPSELSGGLNQRLSLARALAADADLLLLDEPFSALDAALKERVAELVKNANKDGLTLVITHDLQDAALLGAKVLTLKNAAVTTLDE